MVSLIEDGALWLPFQSKLPLHLVRLGEISTMLVENKKLAQDMSHIFGGRAAKPEGVVTIPSADGTTPIMVAGMGQCEVAEMEDIAIEAMEKDAEQIKKTGSAIDFAAERERRGYGSAESFDTRYREYLQARADYGKAHIRTRLTEPMRGMGKGQSMVTVPANYPGGNE